MKLGSVIRNKISHYSWDLAVGDYNPSILKVGLNWSNVHIINNPYKTKWFADPFILEEDDCGIHFLVEEFDDKVKKGRIARIVVDKKNYAITECHIILDLPTHLSFPAIYKIDDKIYVHPENSASGGSYIYRYDRSNDQLVEPVLVIDRPVVDPIILHSEGLYRMYATEIPNAGGRKLNIYESTQFMGTYKYKDFTEFKKREARMAGAFLETEDGLIRPAQDCNRDYGEAVVLYNGDKVETVLKPSSVKYEGLHTFNTNGKTFVIDLKKYDFAVLHQCAKRIKSLIF